MTFGAGVALIMTAPSGTDLTANMSLKNINFTPGKFSILLSVNDF